MGPTCYTPLDPQPLGSLIQPSRSPSEPSARRTPPVWLVLVLGGLLALHATAPRVVVSNDPWDIFVALDGGWHVANGH